MDTLVNTLLFLLVIPLVILPFFILWRFFEKAGKPGWASLIPIYNIIVLNEIAGRPGWWVILYFIPFVNIVISVVVAIDIAKAFGRSTTFGVIGLFLFSLIGYAIIAFSDNMYSKPIHT